MGSVGIAALMDAINPLNSTTLLLKDPSQLLLSAVVTEMKSAIQALAQMKILSNLEYL